MKILEYIVKGIMLTLFGALFCVLFIFGILGDLVNEIAKKVEKYEDNLSR